jgi:hypothetical protein
MTRTKMLRLEVYKDVDKEGDIYTAQLVMKPGIFEHEATRTLATALGQLSRALNDTIGWKEGKMGTVQLTPEEVALLLGILEPPQLNRLDRDPAVG